MPVPNMAIGFVYGPTLNQTLNNNSFFNFTLQQSTNVPGKSSVNVNVSMGTCQPTWLQDAQNYYHNLSCVVPANVLLQGIYPSTTNTSYYPRIQVNLCNNASGNCSNVTELYQMTSGGRIFLFVEKAKGMDLQTGELVTQPLTYDLINFFVVPYLYNRATIVFELVTYHVSPNYLTRWTPQTYKVLEYVRTEFINSNVSYYNQMNAMSIMLRMNPQSTVMELSYQTSIARFSLWGAFWALLFSIFAIVFLGYNRNKFNKERPDWENFDQKFDKMQTKITTNEGKQDSDAGELPDISKFR